MSDDPQLHEKAAAIANIVRSSWDHEHATQSIFLILRELTDRAKEETRALYKECKCGRDLELYCPDCHVSPYDCPCGRYFDIDAQLEASRDDDESF